MLWTETGQMIVTTAVEFDLAVTAPTGKKSSADGEALLLAVVPLHDHKAPTTVNRLRFKVPVVLPTQDIDESSYLPKRHGADV